MSLVIAIVGRPNVGKSTLFNRLTKSRDALVADLPGLTRDRQYGEGRLGDGRYLVIDTGGLNETDGLIDALMTEQTALAIQEADVVCLMVDGQAGLTAADEVTAKQVRATGKPVYLVVNKVDGMDADVVAAEFNQLGFDALYAIAALHGRGVRQLITAILDTCSMSESVAIDSSEQGIKFAIVGRPNVGKSTLVNRMLGEERVVVFDAPGTTRDSIYIPMERRQQRYTIIDTAGVRRRSRVERGVEKFSVVKTLQAIEQANVVVFLIDAQEGIAEQDLHLLGFILDAGRAVVLAVNKWDGLTQDQKQMIRKELDRRLRFLDFARLQFISALHGTGVGDLFTQVCKAYRSATKELTTQKLTKILEDAVTAHPPPLVRGRRIKLRYAHPGGSNPPIIVIHGNQTAALPHNYQRYLMNVYRKALALVGTPVRLEFKTGENPYAGQRNKLTPRQQRKRKRLMRFVKKR